MSNKNSNNMKGIMDQILHPISAILYLAKDRSYSNPRRYSKIQALADLVEHEFRCRQEEEKVSLNLSNLAKRWNWSRPTVISYVNNLHEMGVLLLEDSKDGKTVTVNPDIFRWEDSCEDSPYGDNRGSSRPLSLSPHFSSNESEDNIEKTK